MAADKYNLSGTTKKIDNVVGTDWGATRARAYIAATVAMLEKSLAEVSNELKFEKEVNKRVMEIMKGRQPSE